MSTKDDESDESDEDYDVDEEDEKEDEIYNRFRWNFIPSISKFVEQYNWTSDDEISVDKFIKIIKERGGEELLKLTSDYKDILNLKQTSLNVKKDNQHKNKAAQEVLGNKDLNKFIEEHFGGKKSKKNKKKSKNIKKKVRKNRTIKNRKRYIKRRLKYKKCN